MRMHPIPALAMAVALACAPAPAPARADAQSAEGRSFVESFKTLDGARWLVSHGWSNGDYQACTFDSDNVAIGARGGLELKIAAVTGKPRPWSCAEVQSRQIYGYGTYEVRLASARSPGVVTGFFTYTGPGQQPGRPHDEIDFEFLGKDTLRVQLNYFVGGDGSHGSLIDLGFDSAAVARNYAFEWRPDALRWFIDGRMVREVLVSPDRPLPTHSGKILLSLWIGEGAGMDSWLGRFSPPEKPLSARFEWVAFTRLGEPCQFLQSLVCLRPRR